MILRNMSGADMATGAFIASGLFIVYVLFLYPCILWVMARHRHRPLRKERSPGTVSVLIPVRNGAAFLRAKLRAVLSSDYPSELFEVIVISDGSTDETEEIVDEFPRVRLIRIPWSGKAVALNAGMAAAHGEILVFTDVRQPVGPTAIRSLCACFADDEVGVVSGEPVIFAGESRAEIDIGLYYRYETCLRRWLTEVDSMLSATGAFYAIRGRLAEPLPADTLVDDVHLPLLAVLKGYRSILEPSARVYDYPTALSEEFRRKVRTLAGVYQLVARHPSLLTPANRMWFHFFSYKLGRLLLPFALLIAAASCLFELDSWGQLALWPQIVFYGAALVDIAVPQHWRIKRLSSPARTFVVLMAAALCAISIIFRPAKRFWTRPTEVRQARCPEFR